VRQAFEDNYNIENILRDGGVAYGAFQQHWTTKCGSTRRGSTAPFCGP
jgi:hypothetical protein